MPLNCLKRDIPTKIIKQSSDIFASLISKSFNNIVESSTFPAALKLPHITTVLKKGSKIRKKIIGLLVSCQIFQKSIKEACINKCLITLVTLSVGFAKVSVRSNVF